jgi:hypothetical protein
MSSLLKQQKETFISTDNNNRNVYAQLAEASAEGQGPRRAVEPMMMMMMNWHEWKGTDILQ